MLLVGISSLLKGHFKEIMWHRTQKPTEDCMKFGAVNERVHKLCEKTGDSESTAVDRRRTAG
jgi:hypothetical protein